MHWNDDSGDWQGLSSDDQAPRYRRLAELIGCAGSVLDVGCGEAVLRSYLPNSNYFGIEPSAKASRGHAKVERSTAESFAAGNQRWDCIVFNEVLYYSEDPLCLLHKYSHFLNPDGRMVISIYQNPRVPSFKKKLQHFLKPGIPLSNTHCSQMVSNFLAKQGWDVRSDELVNNRWRMWAVGKI